MDGNNPQEIKPTSTDGHLPVAPAPQNEPQASIVTTEASEEDIQVAEQDTKKEGIKGILSTIAILIIAPLIALSLTAFVFQSYEVDGPSMETTLQNQDRLIVYKLPRTIARITGNDYVPKRAEIVIFTRQDSFEFGSSKPRQLIKRVIGLPGERVVVTGGVLTVYNSEHPDGFQPDKIAPYGKVIQSTAGEVDVTVPEGEVYVCGDNRPQSLDSRSFGPVPVKDLVGRLSLRVYPFNKGEVF
jgi:signal peptidase I